MNKKIVFIDNGHTFANKMDGAWNGDFSRMFKRSAGIPINRNGPEWAASMKPLVANAKKNKTKINEVFDAVGLPKAEQKAFWGRVRAEATAAKPAPNPYAGVKLEDLT